MAAPKRSHRSAARAEGLYEHGGAARYRAAPACALDRTAGARCVGPGGAGPVGLPGRTAADPAAKGRGRWRRALCRPGQLHRLRQNARAAAIGVEQPVGEPAGHRLHRAHGLPVCLRAHAQLHALQRPGAWHHPGAAVGAFTAVGHLLDLLVWQPGRAQELDAGAGGGPDLWRTGHRAGGDLLDLSARADDSGHFAGRVGRAPV
jgi:hypothetical protein